MADTRVQIEHKRVEEELHEKTVILHSIYGNSPFLIGVIEVAKQVVLAIDVNNAAVRCFALECCNQREPLLGMATDANAFWSAQCNHCLKEGLPVSFEYEHAVAGSKRLLSVVIASIGSADRDHPRFTFIAEDIAKRNRWKDEILRSQARLSDILANISDGFLSVNYQWQITYANQRAALNSPYEQDELLGRNLWEVFPELINTRLETDYRKAMTQRVFRHTEVSWGPPTTWFDVRVFPNPEGISIYWADISERKMAEENLLRINEQLECRIAERTGELARMVSSLLEAVDERKKTEQQLLHLNRLYAVMSETTQTIVHTTHRDSLFQEICRVAIEHGGFKLAWIGLLDENGIIGPQAWSGFDQGFLDLIPVFSQEQPIEMPATCSAIKNEVLWICDDIAKEALQPWCNESAKRGFGSAAAIPLKLNGKVIGAFTLYAEEPGYFNRQLIHLLQQMAVNISFALENVDLACRRLETERKLAQESDERLKTMEKLHQRERMLMEQNRHAAMGEMIGNIAHQWRQPLNSLALLLQRLPLFHKAGKLDAIFLEDNVNTGMSIVNHMSQTIDDFRNFFKPEKCRTTFKLAEVVAKTQSLVEASFNDLGITVDIRAENDPLVSGYPNEYSQILLNILINARDAFLQRNDIAQPRIIIRLGMNGSRTVVTVTDNAGGIPDDFLPKIFDPYFTTKGPDKGTGIGLHMAKTIIENNMKGMLTARNTGEGAEFRIEV
ncbi:GAF domain-containing protein [Geotalea toluenoxydans]|uniref:GAF domain-containing protein n=1 Tax=Geotalea toluenoxydans TaxID=421624 RepID=UPI0006D0BE6F|nr:GAF domain-containing protein [Geotalea toluenoxydans]